MIKDIIQSYLELIEANPAPVTEREVQRVISRLEAEGYTGSQLDAVPDLLWDRIIDEEVL